MKKVFITGGAGYIGSHLCELLYRKGYQIRVYDNLTTSSKFMLQSACFLSGSQMDLIIGDVLDSRSLCEAMLDFRPDIVIHLAGLKSVQESFSRPELYQAVNVEGTQNVLDAMSNSACNHVIFSSSATVYGNAGDLPVTERHMCKPLNPYGESKFKAEELITTWARLNLRRSAIFLRYFNPVGAHTSGRIGEDLYYGSPNLMNMISRVALGEIEYLPIFGTDYLTEDGTAERDYIHVLDLVAGHEAAIIKCLKSDCMHIYNLGTGTPISVRTLLHEFQNVAEVNVKYEAKDRRLGDAMISYASAELAKKELKWQAKRNVTEMCKSQWRWLNNGYQLAKAGRPIIEAMT